MLISPFGHILLSKFFDYYGAADYADKLAIAGFDGTSVTLSGKVFDFSSYGFEARSGMFVKLSLYKLQVRCR
jgi:hypothetical protein